MDDIEQFTKNEKELETLIQTIMLYSQDKGIEFVIEKCAMVIMRSRKRQMTEGIELPNQGKDNSWREKNHKYLRKADTIKQVEMKEYFFKEYLRRTRKQL